MKAKWIIVLASAFLFWFLYILTEMNFYESVACVMLFYFFLEFIYNLGKKVIIMDLAVLMAVLTCIFMPVIFYHIYTRDNYLASLWVKYMPVDSDRYFSFAIPAVLMMVLGLRIPLKNLKINSAPKIYMENVKKYLKPKANVGLVLIAVGVFSGFLDIISFASIKQLLYFFEHLTYVGVFYVLYSPSKYKRFIVPGVVLLMVGQSLITGMFGELIYMLACSLILILLGSKITFRRKLSFAVFGLVLILLVQSVKLEYRQKSWIEGTGASPILFATLVTDRLSNLDNFLDINGMFFTSVRLNQGWLVAMTMKRVPERFPFAYGESIANSVAAAIVPRFLWPDKPQSGGKANLKRFWGYNLVGFSMNIGPLGEAYANFDVVGGIVFMFFYGLFFNYILSSILKYSEKRPSIVLWLPFLFFYAISMETDILTTMGSLIKGLIFTWIVFRLFRIAFRIDL